jgi:hypothetical protein
MKICYKVVRMDHNEFVSSSPSDFTYSVSYELNKWTYAPKGTRLFVFKNFGDAKHSGFFDPFFKIRKEYKIFKCQVKGGFDGYPAYGSAFKQYWGIINSFLMKKKSTKKFFENPELYNLSIFDLKHSFPSYLVKAVKLIEEVNI